MKNPFRYVMVPAVARQAHGILLEQQAKAAGEAETCSFNSMTGNGPWGIVTSGVSYSYVKDAVADLGIKDKVRLLKLGFTHPLPCPFDRTDFLGRVEKVLVVEELEPYLEEGIRALAATAGESACPDSGQRARTCSAGCSNIIPGWSGG